VTRLGCLLPVGLGLLVALEIGTRLLGLAGLR
jgi:hypothetical protein